MLLLVVLFSLFTWVCSESFKRGQLLLFIFISHNCALYKPYWLRYCHCKSFKIKSLKCQLSKTPSSTWSIDNRFHAGFFWFLFSFVLFCFCQMSWEKLVCFPGMFGVSNGKLTAFACSTLAFHGNPTDLESI